MPKHDEVRPRGYFAKKAGKKPASEVRFVQVADEVWDAFDGDMKAIEHALRTLAGLVAATKSARKKKRSAA